MQSFDFADRLMLVTGAAQGIGAAVVQSLVQAGARVAGLDIQPDKLNTLKAGLEPQRFSPYRVDVSRSLKVNQAIEQIEQDLGPIAGLVNGAGILSHKPLVSITDADWERTFAVNATGVFNLSRSVAKVMIPRRSGAIVTIGSNAASVPRQQMAAYAASKAAATHFTRCLGLELASFGIRCNVVSPGSTDTPMQHALWTDTAAQQAVLMGSLKTFRTGIPLGRIASPADIADGVMFLLSDQARHITMHDLRIDGGATLGH
ncbi:MAG: 2,3-dihydro-2,3-dihydroxybenzoate dehydrogenase [Leptolyngbyaceae cyanobacterium SM1_1_3]|nr:2,3-dihydro-2,3-dihydroxybenzoate dehydrogenase [Leptolyngbyaceae cyanobacterium SM1_1_3]NJO08821.1 2,3-dihydro-2,3-dihydroxybenzoate dehydrogenase [Leptolyngbyaceae cyanobacterium SL_1_1]